MENNKVIIEEKMLENIAGGVNDEDIDELEESNEVQVDTVFESSLASNPADAVGRFKRASDRGTIITELRKREHYEKPSVKRKKKSEAARKKAKRY